MVIDDVCGVAFLQQHLELTLIRFSSRGLRRLGILWLFVLRYLDELIRVSLPFQQCTSVLYFLRLRLVLFCLGNCQRISDSSLDFGFQAMCGHVSCACKSWWQDYIVNFENPCCHVSPFVF